MLAAAASNINGVFGVLFAPDLPMLHDEKCHRIRKSVRQLDSCERSHLSVSCGVPCHVDSSYAFTCSHIMLRDRRPIAWAEVTIWYSMTHQIILLDGSTLEQFQVAIYSTSTTLGYFIQKMSDGKGLFWTQCDRVKSEGEGRRVAMEGAVGHLGGHQKGPI